MTKKYKPLGIEIGHEWRVDRLLSFDHGVSMQRWRAVDLRCCTCQSRAWKMMTRLFLQQVIRAVLYLARAPLDRLRLSGDKYSLTHPFRQNSHVKIFMSEATEPE